MGKYKRAGAAEHVTASPRHTTTRVRQADISREPGGEIGGYFGMDLPLAPLPFGDFTAFQSARAAFHAVLAASPFKRVFIPSYICDSVILAAKNAGLMVTLYDLDDTFLPKGLPDQFSPDQALIYVNYFGLAQEQVEYLINRFGGAQVLIDQSQALFAPLSGAYAEIFSPRKFVGLPDGGWVSPAGLLAEPETEDDGSIDRLRHLMLRFAYSARAGYADFNAARVSLADTTPKRMSRLTQRLLHTIDWSATASIRRANYEHMAVRLDPSNARSWKNSPQAVPLCYPYTRYATDMSAIREVLANSHNIFLPTYWPDVSARANAGSLEKIMTENTLFLPIDQRINADQVGHICDVVLGLL